MVLQIGLSLSVLDLGTAGSKHAFNDHVRIGVGAGEPVCLSVDTERRPIEGFKSRLRRLSRS